MAPNPALIDYQLLFQQQPDALLLLDPDGVILDNTDAYVAASFKPRQEVKAATCSTRFLPPTLSRRRPWCARSNTCGGTGKRTPCRGSATS
jgi:PAS domain-containing protein